MRNEPGQFIDFENPMRHDQGGLEITPITLRTKIYRRSTYTLQKVSTPWDMLRFIMLNKDALRANLKPSTDN